MVGFSKKIFIIVAFTGCSIGLKAQSVEYFVKASLIEKFARFTEWDDQLLGETFIICVLGESPFKGELEKMAGKVRIKDRPIKIKYIRDFTKVQPCQVLFISNSEKNHITEIIGRYSAWNTLLVGDTPGFSEKGVHFNFYYKNNETIHFEVNPKALEKAGLKIDMLLLNLGKITN